MQSLGLFKITLMFSILSRRIVKSREWRKKLLSVSISELQGEIGLRESKKLCLSLSDLAQHVILLRKF